MAQTALSHAPLQAVSAGLFSLLSSKDQGAPLATKLDAKRWSKFVRIQLGGVEKRERTFTLPAPPRNAFFEDGRPIGDRNIGMHAQPALRS